MSRWLGLAAAVACSGCGALFGLDEPARRLDAAVGEDSSMDVGIDVAPENDLVRAIDIVDSQVIGGPHTDFVVLVSVTDAWLRSTANGGDVTRDDGFDIYFSTDEAGLSRLSFELASYNATVGTLNAWVKVPSLSAATSFYMHYGSASITTSQENIADTWSGNYELAMHLGGTTDVSGNVSGITATNVGSGTGYVGAGSTFNGNNSTLDATSSDAIDNLFAAGGTASIWIRPSSFGENALGRMFDKGGSVGWAFFVFNSAAPGFTISFAHGTGGDTEAIWRGPGNAITTNAWQHVAVVFDKDAMANVPVVYVNGVSVAMTVISTPDGPFASDADFTLKLGNNEALDRTFEGVLDEARLSSVPRSAGWITTEYHNQMSPSGFITIGAPR